MRVHQLNSHSLIFRTHSSSRYSVAALIGALELDERLKDLCIQAPSDLGLNSIQESIDKGLTIVAHSIMSTQTRRVYNEVKKIREQFGDNLIVIGGGAHASIRPKELLENGFDYVVVGEGEKAFPELIWHLINGSDPLGIPGVVDKTIENVLLVIKKFIKKIYLYHKIRILINWDFFYLKIAPNCH